MAANSTNNPLPPIPANFPDTGEIQWDELNKVKQLNDNHIKNIVLKIMGFGNSEYNAGEIEKEIWIRIFKIEWARRHPKTNMNKDEK